MKSRYISLITYASPKQVKAKMVEKVDQLRGYAYILHDQDEAEPHIHLVVSLYEARTPTAIKNWFKGLKDKKGEYVNTMGEVVGDLEALEDYLCHHDIDSQNQGKHWYPREAIVDMGLFSARPKHYGTDSTYDIINDIIVGTPLRELIRRYGREFVYRWTQFIDLAGEIRAQEGYSEAKQKSRDHLVTYNMKTIDTEKEFET